MKSIPVITIGFLLGTATMLTGQQSTSTSGQAGGQQASGQVMGRGRGGAPFAWNDKNKDGVCDVTGLAVGQGGGRGRGMAAGRGGRGGGNGMGRGMGRGFRGQQR
jgi:hypothetical protein